MKTLKLGTLLILGLALVSCGGNKKVEEEKVKEEVLPVEAKTVKLSPFPGSAALGDDTQYFTFTGEDGEADITLTGTPEEVGEYAPKASGTIKAVVKIKIKPMPEKMHGFASSPTLPLYIFNEDKEQPDGHCRLEMVRADADALEALVKEGKGGEITVIYKYEAYEDTYNKIFDEAKYYRIESVDLYTEKEYNSGSSSSSSAGNGGGSYSDDNDDDDDDTEVASVSSSSNNWDQLLDEYEEYVNDLISLTKKVKNGDPSAIADYTSVLNDCQSLSNKMAKAKSNLTSAQLKRLNQIANKYAKLAK